MRRNIQKFLAFCGVIGPILFAVVLFTLGFSHPNYNHISQFVSELGAVGAPYALLMNVFGFCLLGFLIIVFAFGLDRGIKSAENILMDKVGPLLVVVSGVGFILVGVFPCDPDCITVSTIGVIHGYAAIVARSALIIAPLFIYRRLKDDENWSNYHIYGLIFVIVGFVFVALYEFNELQSMKGLFQRISFGVPLIWVEIMAIRLLRIL